MMLSSANSFIACLAFAVPEFSSSMAALLSVCESVTSSLSPEMIEAMVVMDFVNCVNALGPLGDDVLR